jgi:recombination protein RecA
MADDLDKLLASKAVAKMKKNWGDAIFTRASDFGAVQVPRIPTGIMMLDYALGGGFPAGRMNVLWGNKSAGKTTTFLKAIGQAQRRCASCWSLLEECTCGSKREPVVAFLDVEGTLDLPWAAKMGVNLDRLLLSIPEYAEQTLDIAEAVVRDSCDVLCIDSLAFMTPAKEIEESVSKETVGLQARILGKGIRKFVSAVNARRNETGRGPTLFFTNQIRMKVGVMFGSPETQPGGMAPGFAATTETKLGSGKYEMDDLTGMPLTAEFKYRVEKNKSAPAKMEGEYKMCLMDTENRKVGDIFNEGPLVKLAEKVGLVSGGGSKWTALDETFKAKSLVEMRLIEDKAFYTKMHKAVMATLSSQG